MDLAPARWIWLPGERTLANTFVLFRRELTVAAPLARATGWITADSRYRLTVNGQRVQWGPAPCDPRWLEVDPVDLTARLRPGRNVIGVEVLYYGAGDGTYAMGAPGLLARFDLEFADGTTQQLGTDDSWSCRLDRAHRPGMYRRWFLRALQEEYDARLHPAGWDQPDHVLDLDWLPVRVLPGAAHLPSLAAGANDYLLYVDLDPQVGAGNGGAAVAPELRARTIPLMHETLELAQAPTESGRVHWRRDPADWFEQRIPDSFTITREPVAVATGDGWELPATPSLREAVYLTCALPEQMVGWPRFTIDAPAGTVVELMVREAHDPVHGNAWLDTYICHWTRFICAEGRNEFETFDYESVRWLQLHVRGASRPVRISAVGLRRRVYPWVHAAAVQCAEPALQRLFDASVNTLRNCALETLVDGVGRERQQYSGDGGLQAQAVRYAFGEAAQSARFLTTFSQGLTRDGYFLDCWPAFDRLARLMQRQIGTTVWGPILDHGVQFSFDCWWHLQETGRTADLAEAYPRLLRFAEYLRTVRDEQGLMKVENLGIPSVWIDHWAYQQQRHKQCAFTLYTAAMFTHALAPLARHHGDLRQARAATALGARLLAAAVARFWDPTRRLFVNNLPWLAEEGGQVRLCDRSLATAVQFGQCPGGDVAAAAQALADCPPELGLSYPCNAGWRLRALAQLGRGDVVVRDLRTRWATMNSVVLNNTLQEVWHTALDGNDQWSHCPLAPLYILFTDLLGIRPLTPGFATYVVQPQLADLPALDVTAYLAIGPLRVVAMPARGGHDLALTLPAQGTGTLLLPAGATTDLPPMRRAGPGDGRAYVLPAGATAHCWLPG